jgi:L-aminopeptidase/D-esterase-like protein
VGVPFDGVPGPLNAITDVAGVEVGHVTLIAGEGPLIVGEGPIRTGVTAILPRGNVSASPVFAGWFALNGAGEMTGTAWIEESGLLYGPVMLTNTHSVGIVRDTVIAWQVANGRMPGAFSLPVVAETWDGWLNDANGFHVKAPHVFEALDNARPGPIAEGNVGGGTGMICHQFKGGIGTASRTLDTGSRLGVLVQANHGLRHQLRVAGIPVGQDLTEAALANEESGSIIIVVATDAPLLPHQLKAVAKRAALGLARTGSVAGIHSGDLFLAFSTANLDGADVGETASVRMLGLGQISAVFEASVQATEEAILNALIAAETMIGIEGRVVRALPHDRLRQVLSEYHRIGASTKR